MKNVSLFSIHQKHSGGGVSYIDALDLEKTFGRLVQNFIEDDGDSFVLLETIALSCIVIEAIIREGLYDINPALLLDRPDPTDIALISGKEAKLLQPSIKNVSDVKTSNIGDLLKRFLMFNDKASYKEGIDSLFKYRNRILHVAQNNIIDRYELALLLTKFIFPFIREYVHLPEKEWEQIEKIKKVAHHDYRANLMRLIIKHRKYANKLSTDEKLALSNEQPTLLDYESLIKDHLLCPACKNKTVSVFSGVEYDYSPDGLGDIYGYHSARCRVCEFYYDQDTINEIVDNSEVYFDSDESGHGWDDLPDEFDTSTLDY